MTPSVLDPSQSLYDTSVGSSTLISQVKVTSNLGSSDQESFSLPILPNNTGTVTIAIDMVAQRYQPGSSRPNRYLARKHANWTWQTSDGSGAFTPPLPPPNTIPAAWLAPGDGVTSYLNWVGNSYSSLDSSSQLAERPSRRASRHTPPGSEPRLPQSGCFPKRGIVPWMISLIETSSIRRWPRARGMRDVPGSKPVKPESTDPNTDTHVSLGIHRRQS